MSAYDLKITQRNSTDTADITATIPLTTDPYAIVVQSGNSPSMMLISPQFEVIDDPVTPLLKIRRIETSNVQGLEDFLDQKQNTSAYLNNFKMFIEGWLNSEGGLLWADVGSGSFQAMQFVDLPISTTAQTALDGKVAKITGKSLSAEDFTAAFKTKLTNVATAATANDTDANLKSRANHTGSQTASTISDFSTAANTALGTALGLKSSKASFTAVTTLAAHGVLNSSGGAVASNPTNYNLLSGVLGIADGLNGANAAQNDLATKYNDLSAKFNSLLTWLGTNKNTINDLKTAGAA